MARVKSLAIAFALVLASPAGAVGGPRLVPDDHSVHYIGRFDHADPKAPHFSWSMTGLSIVFHGSQTVFGNFSFPDGGGRLRVIVDGERSGIIQQSSGSPMKQFKLADKLDAGKPHILEIYKIVEDGVMGFGGFQLDAGGEFDNAPKAPLRRLEFIGDSDTAGWCADGRFYTRDAEMEREDAYVTWEMQLARSLGAEPMVEAVSGWGVSNESHPIQEVLNYEERFGRKNKWDYSKWIPDAVVILIGPNDEPQKSLSFIKSYKMLLDMVALNYKDAHPPPKVVHVCGGSINGFDPCEDIQTAGRQFNEEQQRSGSGIKGYYTTITKAHWDMINYGPFGIQGISGYNGCDAHYNEKGHQVVAQDVLPQLREIMSWHDVVDSQNVYI